MIFLFFFFVISSPHLPHGHKQCHVYELFIWSMKKGLDYNIVCLLFAESLFNMDWTICFVLLLKSLLSWHVWNKDSQVNTVFAMTSPAPSSEISSGWLHKLIICLPSGLGCFSSVISFREEIAIPPLPNNNNHLSADLQCSLFPHIPAFPFFPSVPPTDTSSAQPFLQPHRYQPLTLLSTSG